MAQRDLTKNPFVIAAAAAALFLVASVLASWAAENLPSSRSGIYAAFLANGQVYFGTVAKENDRVVVLADVYYLKLPKPIVSQEDLQNLADVSLVKLGNELHGPEDRMEIFRPQILFLERLKPDGRVVKAIENYRQQGAR